MKYLVRARARFEAAHHLHSYKGSPEPIHGHSWQVEAVLASDTLDDEGMAFDFVVLKGHLDQLVGRFHHTDINEVPPFDQTTPTAENLAEWFFRQLQERCPGSGLCEVTVWEGPDCSATFFSDP